ncbi:MAG: hypothetical protein KatS3mg125_1955 [Lysobacterales bacterium]|nr:MAG: hypothetical protein KatS3mg125_1955 [Xanthomonadales bacterium]
MASPVMADSKTGALTPTPVDGGRPLASVVIWEKVKVDGEELHGATLLLTALGEDSLEAGGRRFLIAFDPKSTVDTLARPEPLDQALKRYPSGLCVIVQFVPKHLSRLGADTAVGVLPLVDEQGSLMTRCR